MDRRVVRIASQVPKANDVKIEDAPRPLQQPRRLPASGPVAVCIYKVTDDAGEPMRACVTSVCVRDCRHVLCVRHCCCVLHRSSFAGGVWDTYADKGYPLWQLQITHEVQRSVVFQLRDSLGDFLRSANGDNPSMPATIQELEKQLGVRLIVHTLCVVTRIPLMILAIASLASGICVSLFVCVSSVLSVSDRQDWCVEDSSQVEREWVGMEREGCAVFPSSGSGRGGLHPVALRDLRCGRLEQLSHELIC